MKRKLKLKGRLGLYMHWPLLLGILVGAAAIVTSVIGIQDEDPREVIAAVVFFLAYVVAAVAISNVMTPKIMDELVSFAVDFSQVQQNLLRDFEIPYALVDENFHIVWINRKMRELLGDKADEKDMSLIIPELKTLHRKEEDLRELHLRYEERSYRLLYSQVDLEEFLKTNQVTSGGDNDYQLYAMYLLDETDQVRMGRAIHNQKLVCGLVYVDNYDEALNSTEEVRRSLLASLVDRKILKYLQNYDAIVNEIEKGKYLFVVRQEYLARMQSSKFSVLDDVRGINIGNTLSVTLSIGIGMNADSYTQALEWARHAIDLALGRGGDQTVIKDRDKMSYYGGKTKQVEKSTRVRARVKAHALRQVIQNKSKVVVMGHIRGDVDCVGAGIGIYRAARALNKEAHIVLSDISFSVKPVIEHFFNNSMYSSDMFMQPEEAALIVDEDTALVIVDVNTADRTEAPELFEKTKTVVVIDHHRQSGNSIENPVLSYIEPYASSACEMVTEILQYITDNVKLMPAEADALYAGIVIDTNNFLNETGSRTFEAAAFLRKSGADVTRVRLKLRDDMITFKAKAEAVKNAVIDGSYAFAVCPAEGLENPTIVGAQVANELLNIKGIEASFVFTKVKDTVFISARSLETLNVQLIMERMGGGGHTTIAGAQMTGVPESEAIERVRSTLKTMKANGEL